MSVILLALIIGFLLGILLMILLVAGHEEEKLIERVEQAESGQGPSPGESEPLLGQSSGKAVDNG